MKKFTSKLTVVVSAILICSSCSDSFKETTKEKAAKASKEMCECLKEYSQSKCEEKLNANYSSYVENDDFYEEFNAVNSCGVTIYKKPKKSLKVLKMDNEE